MAATAAASAGPAAGNSPPPNSLVRLMGIALAVTLAGAGGWRAGGGGAALLTVVATLLLGVAVGRQRVYLTLRGAVIGAGFLVVVGPLADRLLFARPMRDRLPAALVTGSLVGAAYGLLRSRRRPALTPGGPTTRPRSAPTAGSPPPVPPDGLS